MKGLCLACKEEMKTKIQDDRAALSQQESGDSGVVKIFRLFKTSCVVGEVNYSCNVNIVENVVHREVVIMKVMSSELCYGRTLSKEVGNGFLFVSA